MIKYCVLFLLLFSQFSSGSENWFEETSPLVNAHQMLLEDNLEASFSSIVQVWQSNNEPYIEKHLNQLLLKGLERDCGKSFSSEPLPDWLDKVIVRRQSIQSTGSLDNRLIIDVITDPDVNSEVTDIRFVKWPDSIISSDYELEEAEEDNQKIQRNVFSLNQRLSMGLYKLTVQAGDDKVYESWVVMGEANAKEVVRWETKDKWTVDKFGLLNPYCALPVMDVGLYDYVDDKYIRIWHRNYEGDYPKMLPSGTYEAERYVLAVSITHKRWQGSIMIEEQQAISRTYDILDE